MNDPNDESEAPEAPPTAELPDEEPEIVEDWGERRDLDKTVALANPEVSALKAEVKRLGEIADAEFATKQAQGRELGKLRSSSTEPAPPTKQTPAPGRIVHVMVLGARMVPQVRPAIVVRVGDVKVDEHRETICVHVFYAPEDGPKSDSLLECAEATEGWHPGEWAWPPRA